MLKRISLLFVVSVIFSCAPSTQKSAKKIKLKIKGSDTVYPLTKLLTSSFQLQNKDCEITIEGGGTTAGVADLIAGKIDVAAASRELKAHEKEVLDSLKREILTYTIAFDGLAVIVNAQNKIEKITREQLEAIFLGKLTNWKEMGGMKEKIEVYALEKNNPLDEFFRDRIMGEKEYASAVIRMAQQKEILKRITSAKGAIGYCTLSNLNSHFNYLSVSYDSSKTFIAPNAFNVQNKSYPISRALYYFADVSKEAEMKLFTDYSKSVLGKRNISEMGFVPPQ